MHFYSKPLAEHQEVPLGDEGRFEALTAHWDDRQTRTKKGLGEANDSYVVSLAPSPEALALDTQLKEILALVGAQGDRVVGHERFHLRETDPKTLLSKGTCRGIVDRAQDAGANLLVIDAELSPSQARNLEDLTGLSVCDREAVILNVFLRHAKTKKARIQVEIAQLEYLRPRIRGLGLDMDQQAGGIMQGKGPGETASELLARRLDGRLGELKKAFARLKTAEHTQRKGRAGCRRIALVGYTNAGKTSLMNALTNAELSAKDMPFQTLDTTSRCLTRHGGDVLLSDTVGFIRRLPKRLLASFASTLAEVRDADLLAMVVDVSDPEHRLHLETTEAVLAELGADTIPRLYVFNKIDRLERTPPRGLLNLITGGQPHVALSRQDPAAVQQLKEQLVRTVRGNATVRLFVPYEATEAMTMVHARCQVKHADPKNHGIRFVLEADTPVLARLQHILKEVRQ